MFLTFHPSSGGLGQCLCSSVAAVMGILRAMFEGHGTNVLLAPVRHQLYMNCVLNMAEIFYICCDSMQPKHNNRFKRSEANLHLSGQFLTFEWKVHRYLSYYRNIKTQFFWFEQTAKDTEQTSKYKILPTTNQTKLSCMKNFHCKNLPKPIVNGEKAPQTCCSLLTNFGINSVKAAGVGR